MEPIGSRFSIEQTTTTLSLRRASPRARTRPTRRATPRRAPAARLREGLLELRVQSSGARAMPPPCPPSVKAGRRIRGKDAASGSSSGEVTTTDRHAQADAFHRLPEEPAILGRQIAVVARATSSTPSLLEHTVLGEAPGEVERGLPPSVGRRRLVTPARGRRPALGIEGLEVRAVGVLVGHEIAAGSS